MPSVTNECPWCGIVETAKRRRWHPDCVTAYRVACFSDDQRKALWKRDRGVCVECGTVAEDRFVRWEHQHSMWWTAERLERVVLHSYLADPGAWTEAQTHIRGIWTSTWHADHRMPLWRAPRDVALADRRLWWGLENLQTLCEAHHKTKTAREAAERAALRSGQPRLEFAA
jgi:5-methylcytosine-specific restriction endonuclease McrA